MPSFLSPRSTGQGIARRSRDSLKEEASVLKWEESSHFGLIEGHEVSIDPHGRMVISHSTLGLTVENSFLNVVMLFSVL